MHIPSMIVDLAVMLLTAGLINILFKKIKLPLILGYILAGFLISPYFPLFFDIRSTSSIETWSEIGVIVLLFYIGLEFDLHKLAKIGGSAVITAVVIMTGVTAIGFVLGLALGLTRINSIFIGVMISISSTAIIQKCFVELNRTSQKYTKLVMGTLIVEDVISIFMLIILPAISVSKSIAGEKLILELALMVCYLIMWLMLGIYLLPTFLNKVIDLMTDEMLVVLSLGICFGMAILASYLGFSLELGAFVAGSLFAGTLHVERIERVTTSIKDIFGSIFFLSVGMMVDPKVIVDHWTVILPITVVAVLAKLIFATAGMLLSGQSLSTSVKSGFSLAPIGEFSFIIASMGISIGVMDAYLYPVIVSASIITILITPFLINNSERFSRFVTAHLPKKFLDKLNMYTSNQQLEEDNDSEWAEHVRTFFSRLLIYGVIMLVTVIAGEKLLYPSIKGMLGSELSRFLTCLCIYIVMALFLRPMLNFHSNTFTALWLKQKSNHLPLVMLTIFKIAVIIFIAMMPIKYFYDVHRIYLLIIALLILFFLGKTDFMASSYLRLETRFLYNLNEKIIKNEEKTGRKQSWLDEDLDIISFIVPESADYLGKSLAQLQWGKRYNIYIVKIRHKGKHIILPGGHIIMHPGDKVFVLGEKKSIENFYYLINMKPEREIRTLKEFMESGYPDANNALACCAVKVHGHEPFVNQALKSSNIRSHWHCVVLGIQKKGYPIIMPDPNMVIRKNDLIWVMGSNNNVGRLVGDCVISPGEE